MADDGGAADDRAKPRARPFSSTDYLAATRGQKKPLDELNDIETARSDGDPLSLRQLTKALEEESGARKVRIDRTSATFSFQFPDGSVSGGTPWAILREFSDIKIDPQILAEALFNKEGLVRIRDADVEKNAKQFAAVRIATGLVWRQLMLTAPISGVCRLAAFFPDRSFDRGALLSGVGFSQSSRVGKMASFNWTNCFVAALPTKPLHKIATAIRDADWRNLDSLRRQRTGGARH